MNSDTELTPPEIWQPALKALRLSRFGVDVCGHPDATIPCDYAYVLPNDGLHSRWGLGPVWCNPPYSKPRPWVQRCAAHSGGAVMLLKADTSTRIWRETIWPQATRVVFPFQRIRFSSPSNPERTTTAPWPSALVFFRLQPNDSVLASIGHVVRLKGQTAE
jgi:hypothetical protein